MKNRKNKSSDHMPDGAVISDIAGHLGVSKYDCDRALKVIDRSLSAGSAPFKTAREVSREEREIGDLSLEFARAFLKLVKAGGA